MNLGGLTEKEKGYLFGLFLGDGYAYHDKKQRHYSVEFFLNSEKDMDIINFLRKLLLKIGTKPSFRKDKRCNSVRVRVRSKQLYEILITQKRGLADPPEEFKIGFISGFIDAEGYVNPAKKMIMLVNTDRNVMSLVKKYLEDLGMNAALKKRKKSRKDKLPSYRLYVPVNFINVESNSVKVQRYKRASR
ncbi:MAG: LAGLIDADG family homing endonuclease [Nanoarchaeota archaeon]|nr:LAGLIDADG family homing endonuclease [Nanoarchaeota archaeon]